MKLPTRLYSTSSLFLLAILLLALVSLSSLVFRGARIDLTEDNLYTLSDGTKAVLEGIEEPITVYFFYSADVARDIPSINTYANRVEEMLSEFASLSGGKLRLNVINPEPFSDDEDRAVELGIEPVPVNDAGTGLYFGMAAANAVDEKEVIPFFQRSRAPLLEYDLAKLIYQLATPEKPVLGFLSSLDMGGGLDPQSYRPREEWVVKKRLNEFFEVETLDPGLTFISDDIKALVLVHPTNLDETALYAIDQFVLRGGRVLAFLDPHASVQPGPEAPASSSDLALLLKTWGVEYQADQVLTDASFALSVSSQRGRQGVFHYGMLSIRESNINQDDVITQGLSNVTFGFAGVLAAAESASTTFVPLIWSSPESQIIASAMVANLTDPRRLQDNFVPSLQQYPLVARVSGPVNSAYKNGPPSSVVADDEHPHLEASTTDINLVLVADSDMLSDRFWVQVQQFFGQQIAAPWANNGDLVINAVDNLLGSNALIGIRSRADYARPFEKVNDLRRQANLAYRNKEQELQSALRETEQKIQQLQGKKDNSNALIISPEQEREVLSFQNEKLKIRKQLREVRYQLNKDINSLATLLKFINIGLVPILLTLVVVGLSIMRRRKVKTSLIQQGAVQ